MTKDASEPGNVSAAHSVAERAARFARSLVARPASRLRGSSFGRRARFDGGPDRVWTPPVVPGQLARYAESNTEGPGIWKWAHYYPVYERHLAKFAGTEATIVEVGIYSGGSLGMWRDFLGPKATIHGIDIAEECRAYEADGIHITIGDQADPAFWREFLARVPQIDVLIDDGGHQAHQQIATLEAVLPHLRRGGVYICEDVAGLRNPFLAYLDGLAVNLGAWHAPDPLSTRTVPTGFQAAVHSIHRYPYLAVIEMNDSPVTEFHAPRYGTDWVPF